MKRLPESERRRLRTLIYRGLTDAQIGARLGLSPHTIRHRRIRWGFTRWDTAAVMVVEIAAEAGVRPETVALHAAYHGVPVRKYLNVLTVTHEDAATLRAHYATQRPIDDVPHWLTIPEAARRLGVKSGTLHAALNRRTPWAQTLRTARVRARSRWAYRICPASIEATRRAHQEAA